MKIEIKAALLSGFVFPGTGQMYLRRYLRGLIMMIFVFVGLASIVAIITSAALERLNIVLTQGGVIDINDASKLAVAQSLQSSTFCKVIFLLIICCWIFSITDAYRIAKRRNTGTPDSFIAQ
jgi:hypothetical protein